MPRAEIILVSQPCERQKCFMNQSLYKKSPLDGPAITVTCKPAIICNITHVLKRLFMLNIQAVN